MNNNYNEKYIELLGLKEVDNIGVNNDKEEKNKRRIINSLLKEARDERKFEIGNYWIRTGYFVLLVGAIFVGYCTKDMDDFVKIILNILGFFVSFIWYLSNRGAKFWQENWELHVDLLEGEIGTLYKLVLQKETNKLCNLLSGFHFSSGKCNILISLLITISWLILLIYKIVETNCIALFVFDIITPYVDISYVYFLRLFSFIFCCVLMISCAFVGYLKNSIFFNERDIIKVDSSMGSYCLYSKRKTIIKETK
jgi:hypothetical protein